MKAVIQTLFICILFLSFDSAIHADEPTKPFADWHQGWNVREAISNAQVVIVVRVTHVGKVKVVEGAKTNRYFREYRFQPMKTLKGVYARDELTMSDQDLGCRSATGIDAKDIKEGQLRLLSLSQSNPLGSAMGCAGVASSTNFRQSVPLLSKIDDPIVQMYEAMIKVDNLRSRKERTQLLVDTIKATSGPALVPLLNAIQDDLIWAAANAEFGKKIVEINQNDDTVIRQLAFSLICDASSWLTKRSDKSVIQGFGEQIKNQLLSQDPQPTIARIKALNSAIALEAIKSTNWLDAVLIQSAFEANTFAERHVATKALGDLEVKNALAKLTEQLKNLPLDAGDREELLLFEAIGKIDNSVVIGLARSRLLASLETGQSMNREVLVVGNQETDESTELIMALLDDPRAWQIQVPVIKILGQKNPPGAVEKLGCMLRNNASFSVHARQALLQIGSKSAAIELRPLLKTLQRLNEKLPVAKLLAKHGMDDGYSMAIEHLADGGNVSRMAAEVLMEIDSDESRRQLVQILESNADRKWYVGAIAGLLAMENEKGQQAFAEVIADDHHPLLLQTLALSEFAGKRALLNQAPMLVESRNIQIVIAALSQINAVLETEPLQLGTVNKNETFVIAKDPKSFDRERKLLQTLKKVSADSYVHPNVQALSMELLVKFNTGEIKQSLIEMVDRVDLKGNSNLRTAEREIKKRQIDLN